MNKERLLKLADFLAALPPERFDFREIIHLADGNACGSVCCAIGWLPAVFPEQVHWGRGSSIVSPTAPHLSSFEVARRILDLDRAASEKLFLPWEQTLEYEEPEGDADVKKSCEEGEAAQRHGHLLESASAKQVAAHIRAYVASHEN